MNSLSIADAIATRFVGLTANGESLAAVPTARLPNPIGAGPVILVYPPVGTLDVGVSARRLVDDNDILVLMDDRQRNVFRRGRGRHGFGEGNLQRLAGFHLVARRGYRLALDSDGAFRNKGLKPRPAHIGKGADEGEVEAAGLGGDRFKNSRRL